MQTVDKRSENGRSGWRLSAPLRRALAVMLGLGAQMSLGAQELVISDAYARASLPGQVNTVAYMQLHNRGERPIALVGASSAQAGAVALHQHVQRGAMMGMEPVARLSLAPGQRVALEPGGYHLMVTDLHKPLQQGDRLALTLTAADGRSWSLQLPVRSLKVREHHH